MIASQEMLQEIEQKVTSLSDSSSGPEDQELTRGVPGGQDQDLIQDQGVPGGQDQDLIQDLTQDQGVPGGLLSAGSESAELLASKLDLLKTNLVSFQHLLEERQPQDEVNYTTN